MLSETVPAPSWGVVALTALFAFAVTLVSIVTPPSGRRSLLRNANVLGTLFHEGGHALVAMLVGGDVRRVEIDSAEGGATLSHGHAGLGTVLVSAAGYAMPPLAGLGAAALLHRGHVSAVLVLTLVAMVFLLLLARDPRTFVLIIVVGAVVYSALRYAPAWLRTAVAYTEAWLLLTSELSGVQVLVSNRRSKGFRGHTDDAALLAKQTKMPSPLWIGGWFLLNGWAIWHAAPLLFP
ncbi:M50 family metallopeptidase [Amycolatopsis vancoresmycina]|uniref:Integral membrane protein n=1 Tax=Amycolatopsis vancoresmycina DSM 44592 TaxID=1292037 RepID=R1FT66_9PSEU|nr:M50 family metallopeptidase [Amycolatopsis vancoresmycina]EOD62548.1 integral membrane protein [Amycolatopsis vancoresmycina DSM 44592]